MQFIPAVIAGRAVERVQIDFTDALWARALDQARRKAPYTHVGTPGQRPRPADEVLGAQILGTLADIACAERLRLHLAPVYQDAAVPCPGPHVQRYDDVRDDAFRLRDQYDVALRCARCCRRAGEVEVRSSVGNRIPFAPLLKTWHVLGWYTTNAKPAEPIRPLYMRPLYHWNRHAHSGAVYAAANAEQMLRAGELDLYLVGGATDTLLRTQGRVARGFGLLQEGANYQLLDIPRALDMPAFLAAATTLVTAGCANCP